MNNLAIQSLHHKLDNVCLLTVGPGFDDELWRIRQEVNKLKETLAMQSAYVQGMPNSSSFASQAGLPPPFLSSVGTGMGGGLGVGVGAGGDGLGVSGCGCVH